MQVDIRPTEIKALSWAVREAEAWRGSLVGAAPQAVLDAFDRKIKTAKNTLTKIRKALKEQDEASVLVK